MKNKRKTLKQLNLIKNVFLFILIFILFSLPVLKQFYPITLFVIDNNLIFLKIIGSIGLFFLVINLYISFEKSENKKQYLKNLIPIFLLVLYMIWTFISALFAENKELAFNGTEYRKEGYFTYLAYAGIFGLAFCIDSKKIKKKLLYSFLVIAIFTTILSWLAEQNYFNNIFWSISTSTSSFYNSNHYGYYLLIATSISAFLFITEKNKTIKVFNMLIYIYFLYSLILNNTFGCYLALLSTLIIFFVLTIIKKEKKFPIFLLMIIFVLLSILIKTKSYNITTENITSLSKDVKNIISSNSTSKDFQKAGSGRMNLWINGINLFFKKPILGYGPENLGIKYLETGITIDKPHNLLIQLATTSGAPGLILYISSVIIILWRSFKLFNTKNLLHTVCMFTIVAYLISAMFGNSMYYTSPYYFILLGFLFYELINIK